MSSNRGDDAALPSSALVSTPSFGGTTYRSPDEIVGEYDMDVGHSGKSGNHLFLCRIFLIDTLYKPGSILFTAPHMGSTKR